MNNLFSDDHFELKYDPDYRIMSMCFKGDISDDAYKQYWEMSVKHGGEQQCQYVMIDQSEIGNVSFKARGWVVVKMLPIVKKVMPKNLTGAILSSSNFSQKAGVQYLVKAFQSMTGYTIEFKSSESEAMDWFKSMDQPAFQTS